MFVNLFVSSVLITQDSHIGSGHRTKHPVNSFIQVSQYADEFSKIIKENIKKAKIIHINRF